MRVEYLRYNRSMNTNNWDYDPAAPSNNNLTRLTAILESGNLGYSYRRETFLKNLAMLLANAVDDDTFNRAVVEAAFFAE
jgi:hypothetical protein